MEEHVINTGDTGRLRIKDYTDDPDKMYVEMAVQSLSPVSIPQLPWTYSKDASMSGWKSFNFTDTTMWQNLGSVYLGTSVREFTLHLGSTGTSHLNGPTDQKISVSGYVAPPDGGGSTTPPTDVYIKVGTAWKKATPYVNVNGVWVIPEKILVRTPNGWK